MKRFYLIHGTLCIIIVIVEKLFANAGIAASRVFYFFFRS